MSSSYGRLAAIRDYWMPRDQGARVEVRVTDIDEILRELVRVTTLAAERAAPTPPVPDTCPKCGDSLHPNYGCSDAYALRNGGTQDDEALEVLRELVEAREEFTGAGDPQAIRSAGQRIRTAEAAARALLTKRGAA